MKELQLEYPEIRDDINDLWYYNEEAELDEEAEFVKQLFREVNPLEI